MKIRTVIMLLIGALLYAACASPPEAVQDQGAPAWVRNPGQVFPAAEWVAVTAQGASQSDAENDAMLALARTFKTDVEGITQSSRRFSEMVSVSAGKKSVSFDEAKDFGQDVNIHTNVKGLIGIELDAYTAPDRTVYVNVRMNRRESAARYSGMVRQNAANIDRLIALAAPNGTIEAYARLSFAHAIAQVTDNFQNILEVLDPAAAGRRPGYGGADAIKAKMLACQDLITIGIAVDTERAADKTLFTRAAGTFFRGQDFKINEQGRGNYVLYSNVRFEELQQTVISVRYYLDAALESQGAGTYGTAPFSFTEDARESHINNLSEARRLAVRAVENSLKGGRFAREFEAWLNGLID
jgi:hypothetical protein